MSSTTSTTNSTPNTVQLPRTSIFEDTFGQFYDRTIEATAQASVPAAQFMKDLNQIHQIVSGLGVVMRIVTGNGVLADNYIADDPDCPAPLSRMAEGMLTAMAAAMCERIRDDIEHRAESFNARVPA